MPPSSLDRGGAAPPLVWLHGFTQTGRSAYQFRSILAGGRQLLTPDLPGHGDRATEHATLDDTADQLVHTIPDDLVDLGGYSFGARVALHVALRHPHRVRRLVLLSGTRGILNEELRERRQSRDEALAQRAEILGADAFVDEWLTQPMFTHLPVDPDERATRYGQSATGLANSLRHAGTGAQRWLGDEASHLATPTLLLAGANDERFVREAVALRDTFPHATVVVIPGAGHAAHLSQPSWVAAVINNFLSVSLHEDAGHDEEGTQK